MRESGSGGACAACGHENAPDNRFCGQCGTRLAATCPACGTGNAPGDRFCVQCGEPLGAGPPAASESPST
ncbi:MAG: double zinc ribbon domain-containing protein, partial [Acidimicrobiia bacterium]